MRNLAASIVLHERVETTVTKARAVRTLVERSITRAKQPTLTTRRLLLASLRQPNAVAKLMEVLGPRYLQRPGGYTRITKLGPRLGDAAQQAVIELV